MSNKFYLKVDQRSVEYSMNNTPSYSSSGEYGRDSLAQTKARKKKSDLKQAHIANLVITNSNMPTLEYSKETTQTLIQYNVSENSPNHIVVNDKSGNRIFKIIVDNSRVCEEIEEILGIVNHKCLELEVKRVEDIEKNLKQNLKKTITKVKNKRRLIDQNASTRIIKKLYKQIDMNGPLIQFSEDRKNWTLTIDLHISYKEYSFNKYSIEVNSFLDLLFSKRNTISKTYTSEYDRTHSDKATFIQKRFNNQTTTYTKTKLEKLVPSFESTIPYLDVNLLPFQIKTVQWMLEKELKRLVHVEDISDYDLNEFLNYNISYGYEIIPQLENKPSFWNKFTNYIASYTEAINIYKIFNSSSDLIGAKGLLSEEMGLGKTIEVLGLILLNRRQLSSKTDLLYKAIDGKHILKTKVTLIICPNAILQQWINEVELHAPSKTIFYYKGYQQVISFFNTDSISEIVQKLSQYDIIITSYSIVAVEVHYAEYNANLRVRRNSNYPKYDYSSPLSLMQFFRIILDEVQMLQSDSTNAAKCTSLLHRVHTWGVSGTPIQLIRDFQTILSYLQMQPFQNLPEIVSSINTKILKDKTDVQEYNQLQNLEKRLMLVNGVRFTMDDLMHIFIDYNICIRHTKNDVRSQIKIPRQYNYIVSLDFAPVEWDNYLDLWNNFISASGYGPDGLGAPQLSTIQLNQWLARLRYLCCHAVIPEYNNKSGKNSKNNLNVLHNIDDILKMMTIEAVEKLDSIYRENYQLQIKSAQAKMELQNNSEGAIKSLSLVRDSLLSDIKTKCSISNPFDIAIVSNLLKDDDLIEENENNILEISAKINFRLRARAYMDLLHQCYFFIATGYFFLGSHKLEQVDDKNAKLSLIASDSNAVSEPKKYIDIYSEVEMKDIEENQLLEKEYYAYAEKLRKEILLTREQRVNKTIKETQTFFEVDPKNHPKYLLFIEFNHKEDYASNISISRSFRNLSYLISSINAQAEQFNELISQLLVYSYQPLTKDYDNDNGNDSDDVKEEKAKEYSDSIDNQDKIFAILSCLERILVNRDMVLASDEEIKLPKKLSPPDQQLSDYHLELLTKISLIGGTPLKPIFDDIKNSRIVKGLATPIEPNNYPSSSFEEYLLNYEDQTKRMKIENKLIRDSLKKINIIYNNKIEYYNHLQKISDSLVSLLQLERNARASILRSIRNDEQYKLNLKTISSAESRIKYLNSLNILRESIEQEKPFTCPICLSSIHTGSIIKCGHFFCTKCIHNWLRNKHSCPLCKVETNMAEIYNFKFKDEKGKDEKNNSDENEKLVKRKSQNEENSKGKNIDIESIFKEKYSVFPKSEDVSKIVIKESFGAKIDSVIKLILYLKLKSENENDDPPQILIYSQSLDFLRVISKVLAIHDISCLSSLSNVAKVGEIISKFKKDPSITCLLLNVKSLGSGLNLLNARHIFLLDPIINQSDELQAMSRNNRIGQIKTTFVWNFMIRNSVEENIFKYKCILEGRKKLRKRKEHRDNEDEMPSKEEFEINESTGETVSKQHLWNCFFENPSST